MENFQIVIEDFKDTDRIKIPFYSISILEIFHYRVDKRMIAANKIVSLLNAMY